MSDYDTWLQDGPRIQCECGAWHGAALECVACAMREEGKEMPEDPCSECIGGEEDCETCAQRGWRVARR